MKKTVEKHKKIRGVVVWDFDGVLFELKKARQAEHQSWVELGIPLSVILEAVDAIRADKSHFSMATFIRELRKRKIAISEKAIRRVFHQALFSADYYSQEVDALLHRLSAKGFHQRVLSLGMPSFQYKKISSCGEGFVKHFDEIKITTRPKYLELLKIRKAFPLPPLIFVDDTKENLELADRHVPGIITIHYSNASEESIHNLEEKILHAAKSI